MKYCRAGLHALYGSNVMTEVKRGVVYERCRACFQAADRVGHARRRARA